MAPHPNNVGFNELYYQYPYFSCYHTAYVRGNTARFNIYQSAINDYGWGFYDAIRSECIGRGITVIACVIPLYPPASTNHNDYSAYADLTDQAARYFNSWGCVCKAVEIWNEPNSTRNFVPAANYRALLTAAAQRIMAGNNSNSYGREVRTLTAGYWMYDDWENYIRASTQDICAPWELAIHPYPPFRSENPTIDQSVDRVINKYEKALALYPNSPMWVTETGCSSRSPWGLNGQSDVIRRISARLGNKPECKAMIIHRLYADDNYEPPTDEIYEFNLINRDGSGKPAFFMLGNTAWV